VGGDRSHEERLVSADYEGELVAGERLECVAAPPGWVDDLLYGGQQPAETNEDLDDENPYPEAHSLLGGVDEVALTGW
jgi:hypothetical protein